MKKAIVSESSSKLKELDVAYKSQLEKFINFLEKGIVNIEQQKTWVLMYLTDLEIRLLTMLQLEMEDGISNLLNGDRFIFYVVEAHFIKEFKDKFNIEREREFIHNVVDVVYPKIKSILQKISQEDAKMLFPEPQNVSGSAAVIHMAISTSMSNLVGKMKSSSWQGKVRHLSSGILSEINEIKDYANENFLNSEKFPQTWNQLHEAIKYRYAKYEHLREKLEHERVTALHNTSGIAAEFTNTMEDNVSILLRATEDVLSSKSLDAETRFLLNDFKEDCIAISSLSGITHRITAATQQQLITGAEDQMQLTDEELALLGESETVGQNPANLHDAIAPSSAHTQINAPPPSNSNNLTKIWGN